MPKGVIIPADPAKPLATRDVQKLEDYQAVVGGSIEAVDLPDISSTVFVNEKGLVRKLAFNPRATFLWWYWVPAARQQAMLVGDALVVGQPDNSGSTTDVPLEFATSLQNPHGHRVEVQTLGDPKWYSNDAVFPDYFEAIVWGLSLLERWTLAQSLRIIPLTHEEVAHRLAGEEAP